MTNEVIATVILIENLTDNQLRSVYKRRGSNKLILILMIFSLGVVCYICLVFTSFVMMITMMMKYRYYDYI